MYTLKVLSSFAAGQQYLRNVEIMFYSVEINFLLISPIYSSLGPLQYQTPFLTEISFSISFHIIKIMNKDKLRLLRLNQVHNTAHSYQFPNALFLSPSSLQSLVFNLQSLVISSLKTSDLRSHSLEIDYAITLAIAIPSWTSAAASQYISCILFYFYS